MAISFSPREEGNKSSSQEYPYSFVHDGTSTSGVGFDISEIARKQIGARSSWITLSDGTKFRTATWRYRASNRFAGGSPAVMSGHTSIPASPYNRASCVDISYAGFFLNLSGFSLIQDLYSQDMRNEAVTKAMNNIADQKINLGENLATLKQTYGMFAGKATLLCDALKSGFKNKSFRPFLNQSFRQLRRRGVGVTIAQQYLEYIYGLVPLMSDVYEAVKLLKGQGAKPLLLKGVGMSYRTKEGRSHEGIWSSGYASSWNLNTICQSSAKCTLWARLDPDGSQFRTMNQLGLLNPLSLAYELTPWSFVVDWFLPIGPVLQALTAPSGLIFVNGSMAYRHSQTETERYAPDRFGVSDHMPIQIEKTYGELYFQKEVWLREYLGGWPMPGLWLDGNPLRGDRGWKGLALSIANLGSMRKSL